MGGGMSKYLKISPVEGRYKYKKRQRLEVRAFLFTTFPVVLFIKFSIIFWSINWLRHRRTKGQPHWLTKVLTILLHCNCFLLQDSRILFGQTSQEPSSCLQVSFSNCYILCSDNVHIFFWVLVPSNWCIVLFSIGWV